MVTKDKIKNRAYVAKSRAKLINSIGIEASAHTDGPDFASKSGKSRQDKR